MKRLEEDNVQASDADCRPRQGDIGQVRSSAAAMVAQRMKKLRAVLQGGYKTFRRSKQRRRRHGGRLAGNGALLEESALSSVRAAALSALLVMITLGTCGSGGTIGTQPQCAGFVVRCAL